MVLLRTWHAECQKAERFIAAHKGIDITVLGIGTNGHLGSE